MKKVKFITDTASDIPDEEVQRLGIEMLNIPITVDGQGYYERQSFTIDEYYDVIQSAREIPATSKISSHIYLECFKRAHSQGYTDIIVVTISSTGSGIHESALQARAAFYEENPSAGKELGIYVIDSKTYAIAYGYPIIQAAEMAEQNTPVPEILAYLEGWFSSVKIYLGVFTLEHAKKSGRIGGVSSFVGEMLGLRPIISMIEGETKVIEKARGDKNVALRLFETYKKTCPDTSAQVLIIQGRDDKDKAAQLAALLEEHIGRPVPVYTAGAAIITNTGPRPLALVCHGKSRRQTAVPHRR